MMPFGACSFTDVRKRFSLLLIALLLAWGGSMVMAPRAAAYRTWCRSDPVIIIDGVLVDVFVSAPPDALLTVTGPTEIVVTVPRDVDVWLVVTDLGFGRGESVRFEESGGLKATEDGIEVRVEVYVPSRDDDMPVRVEFAPRILGLLAPTSAEGTANRWIELEVRA